MKWFWTVLFLWAVFIVWFFLSLPGRATDLEGKYKDSPLHSWFDSLSSKRGMCCSFADGRMVDDPDINTDGQHYKVRIDGEWIDVPEEAIVTVPNKFGRAVVWPYKDQDGHIAIRCFMAGAGI